MLREDMHPQGVLVNGGDRWLLDDGEGVVADLRQVAPQQHHRLHGRPHRVVRPSLSRRQRAGVRVELAIAQLQHVQVIPEARRVGEVE